MKPSYGAPGEHDLLLGNQAHALCSSIPLFGCDGMTFVHENRTGPSRGFDMRIDQFGVPAYDFRDLTYPFLAVQGSGISLAP